MSDNTNDSARKALSALANTRFTTYWLDSLDPASDEPALQQDRDCDLLIVGGGFCGLWAAIQAKEQNLQREVVLIEAKSVANGASGRPAAIMSTSVMHGIDNTERIFPADVEKLESLGREFHEKRQGAILKRIREAQQQGEGRQQQVIEGAKGAAVEEHHGRCS